MSLTIALLGILDLTPMTGYDLKKSIAASVSHFWSADQSQIYRTLAVLVADGLAEVEVIPQEGRPDRHEHHITPAGRRALDEWLRSPLQPEKPHDAFLMRLFFVGTLGVPATRAVLRARRSQATVMLAGLQSVVEQEQARREPDDRSPDDLGRRLRHATLRNGILHAQAELAWLTETKEALE
ncbi:MULTISPECIES: PadR family transcriptional regulator [Cryobacterium]|uniref:PadR family transcriptional regulator n=1 Tax=Cryobacterium breve TaxID=1259258 RepID=A0ABY2J8P9_9MICO|nr:MULTISPECIES: PadR family transcriptional regulator [Cryobacterium]TFC95803.1 PadR family transcriptional regulator [Cryobacterium sp. TmT3-12]TFD00242.1 PadR family transcriptional regulator [Cryobacterium breve]